VDGDSGVHLFVREIFIRPGRGGITGEPLLLLHGARVPGLASFDLPVLEGSLAADLARLGFDVYVTDIRGYGRSTRPKEMGDPPSSHAPLVRSNEAAHDISPSWMPFGSAAASSASPCSVGQRVGSGQAIMPACIRRK
jgi:pimeloyl-ACP methyl ester carboxylesterase